MTKEEILNTIVALHGPFVLTSEYVSRYSKVSVNVEFRFVNGTVVIDGGKHTGALSRRTVRRGGDSAQDRFERQINARRDMFLSCRRTGSQN